MKFVLLISCFLIVSPLFAFQSIVILPFDNKTQKNELYWFGEGFAESLSEDLLLRDAYLIQRPERQAVYEQLHLPYSGDLSRATMLKIAEKLSADYMVFGTYNLKEDQLTARVKVIKISSARLSNQILASGSLKNLYQIQTALREELKKYFASERLVPITQNAVDSDRVPLHAYELYIKGLIETTDSERIKFFQRALQALPTYQQAVYRLGIALSHLQRYKESNESLKQIYINGPLKSKSDFMMGLNFYLLRDFDAAYQKWLDLSKTNPTAEVYNNLGVALMRKNDFQNSGWYVNQAVTLDPSNEDYRFNLATSYMQRKYDAQSVQQYRETTRDLAGYQSLYLISKLLEKQNNPVSKTVFQLFQESLPPDQKGKFPDQFTPVQLLRIAPSLLTKEEKQYQTTSRTKMQQQRVEYLKTYQSNARRYIEDQHPDEAIVEIRKGLDFGPLDWYLHYLWGLALYQQKNNSAAVSKLGFSLWCADNVESHLLLAEIYKDVEQYADAKLQIQQCLALDPKNKRALDIWNKIWNKQQ